jgi:hypothetical protein
MGIMRLAEAEPPRLDEPAIGRELQARHAFG